LVEKPLTIAHEAGGKDMKKEFLKGFTMLALVVSVALTTAVISANAQTTKAVMANIPFEFVVGDKTLAAGEYSVRPASSEGAALMIQSTDAKNFAVRLSGEKREVKNNTHARMVFHRYGERYFLAEVWNGDNIGRELAKSKQERAIERELAGIPSKSELAQSTYATVVVAALR
jgi:hypothetical protein